MRIAMRCACVALGFVAACHRSTTPVNAAMSEGGDAAGAAGMVSGQVVDLVSHDGVVGAATSLDPADPKNSTLTSAAGATDLTGTFVMTGVAAGRYTLHVTRPGYKSYSKNVSIGYNGTKNLMISLSRTTGTCPGAIPGRKPVSCP